MFDQFARGHLIASSNTFETCDQIERCFNVVGHGAMEVLSYTRSKTPIARGSYPTRAPP